jgi:hypothetical protein
MNSRVCTGQWWIQVKILPMPESADFLLCKRKENNRDLLHSINTNENHYQFGTILI